MKIVGFPAIAIILLLLAGWVANVVKLVAIVDGGITGWLVLRSIGVFVAPLGAVLGVF